ncbi:hypothetical protein LTR85_006785 [Meristemomyces frigidus]|nr:hypothetical protein LTR85_006785 [Meristemomyces frigidus]
MDDIDVPKSTCQCADYMEWGRHDPRNHRRPPQPGQSGTGIQTSHSASSTQGPAPAPEPPDLPDAAAQAREQTLLDGFREVLAGEGRKATFTCGGRLPFVLRSGRTPTGDLTPRTEGKVQEQKILTEHVGLRFGKREESGKTALPIDGQGTAAERAFRDLVRGCKPATFGRDGKDVYDEEYRRAGALGVDEFMTDFCPYKTGIIDIVTQLLLPPIVGDLAPGSERSELAVQHHLTAAHEQQIRYAVDYEIQASNRPASTRMRVSQLPSLLANLNVPLTDQPDFHHTLQTFDLQPAGKVTFPNIFAIVAKRWHAKRLAEEQDGAVRTPGPNELRRKMLYRGIRAELYKLNVYSGPSGLFKPHVDTPRSDTQIGSLVVCLPAPFQGGALAVRHQGQEILHTWANEWEDERAIQWAAFYSDCEHEVLEVTAGHRLTLTYNLFLAPGTGLLAGNPLSLQPLQLPLFRQLQEALADTDFMPKGGYIGFMLAHSYPHTHPQLHHFVPNMLKGSDMVLYEAVHAAQLICALETVDDNALPREDALEDLDALHQADCRRWPRSDAHPPPSHLAATEIKYEEDDDEACEDNVDMHPSDDEDLSDMDESEEGTLGYRVLKRRMLSREQIVWIGGGGPQELSKVHLAYGNQAELKVKYTKLALLVKVMSWAERSGSGTRENPVSLE